MEKAVLVRSKWKNKIPAATHIDGTARVQTVYKNYNSKFYNLISEFYKITDIHYAKMSKKPKMNPEVMMLRYTFVRQTHYNEN